MPGEDGVAGKVRRLEESLSRLAAWVVDSRYMVAFTGAGMSTESGIPDFRGPGGLWRRYRPIELPEFLSQASARREYWRRKIELYPAFSAAGPNAGHLALAELHRLGKLRCVVTQNIDGLHQKAGIPAERVVELHGSGAYIACLECRRRYEWEEVLPFFEAHPAPECPRCQECGGWLKPATISFGQAMPEEETNRAFEEARRCDLFLTVGSSLQVYPAAAVPAAASGAGARVAIINNEPTGLDQLADLLLPGSAGELLGQLASIVKKHYDL